MSHAPRVAALLVAFGVKAFYARAGADALGWMLGPTAALVGLLTGLRFEAEPGIGYLSREHALVIAPACAGLNHLVISFCLLALGFGLESGRPAWRFGWLAVAAALAYATTLLANAARIALGIALHETPLPAWLSDDQAHRLAGVAVYLCSLWLLAFAAARWRRVAARRAALLALFLYLGVTLLLPLANGAHARPEFWAHARAVLLAALALAGFALGAVAAARGLSRAAGAARARSRA